MVASLGGKRLPLARTRWRSERSRVRSPTPAQPPLRRDRPVSRPAVNPRATTPPMPPQPRMGDTSADTVVTVTSSSSETLQTNEGSEWTETSTTNILAVDRACRMLLPDPRQPASKPVPAPISNPIRWRSTNRSRWMVSHPSIWTETSLSSSSMPRPMVTTRWSSSRPPHSRSTTSYPSSVAMPGSVSAETERAWGSSTTR